MRFKPDAEKQPISKLFTTSAITLILISILLMSPMHYNLLFLAFVSAVYLMLPGYLIVSYTNAIHKRVSNSIEETIALSIVASFLCLVVFYMLGLIVGGIVSWTLPVFALAYSCVLLTLWCWETKSIDFPIDKNTLRTAFSFCKSHRNVFLWTVVIALVSLGAFGVRMYYIMDASPLLPGWDTPRYVADIIEYLPSIPLKHNYLGGAPIGEMPLFYMIAALLYAISPNLLAVPIVVAVIDSLSCLTLFLFLRISTNQNKVALAGAGLYVFSFFALRFFSDLYKEVLSNFLFPLALYFLVKRRFLVSGFVFGLSLLSHTPSFYRMVFMLGIYLVAQFVNNAHKSTLKENTKDLVVVVIVASVMIVPYDIYVRLYGGLPVIDRIYGFSGFGAQQESTIMASVVLWAVPRPYELMPFEVIFIVIGGLYAIFKFRPMGLWFFIGGVTMLAITEFPYMLDHVSAISWRAFYYYGLYSYFFKSVAIVGFVDMLLRAWNKVSKTEMAN